MSFLAEVFTHTSFFLSFLTVFYFLFITYIQNESIVSDLFSIIKSNLVPISAYLDSKTLQRNLDFINSNSQKLDQYGDEINSEFLDRNNKIVKIVAIIVGIVAPILLMIGIALQYSNNESIYELLLSNLIVIGFIAASEFFIVGVFMRNFIEIDSEFLAAIIPSAQSQYNECRYVDTFLKKFFPEGVLNYFI